LTVNFPLSCDQRGKEKEALVAPAHRQCHSGKPTALARVGRRNPVVRLRPAVPSGWLAGGRTIISFMFLVPRKAPEGVRSRVVLPTCAIRGWNRPRAARIELRLLQTIEIAASSGS
jgi:hypothetical protein